MPATHHVLTAELLSIGTELTVGDTRDTNAGELARSLTSLGVRVLRLTALPDDLASVTAAFSDGLSRADMVVSTGGLGPTPDDLTREAIAAASHETVVVDPATESWLRELWTRRGMPFPELNLKQAWLIPSAEALPNPNGTAPGWFVRRPGGGVIVALPGPPREMRPMWANEALPRLQAIGLGADVAARTYRLAGVGESQVAELLGESLLRSTNPVVATYARVEAVDVRISAVGDDQGSAGSLVETAAETVLASLGPYVWATGETTWGDAVGARLGALGWTLAAVEIATGGSLAALFGDVPWVRFDEVIAGDAPVAHAHGTDDGDDDDDGAGMTPARPRDTAQRHGLVEFARQARELGGSEVGIAVRMRDRTADLAVSIAISSPNGERRVTRQVFRTGTGNGHRAALAAAAVLLESLAEQEQEQPSAG